VKEFKEKKSAEELKSEAAILTKIRHPNIVSFYGLYLNKEHPCLVMEYLEGGDLESFLRNNPVKSKDLVLMAKQVAAGMNYLQREIPNFIHRDLACRNLLVKQDVYNGYIVKLSDFGLLTKILGPNQTRPVAIQWQPPEFFLWGSELCAKSDVWSFGMVMWELFEFCKREPFDELLSNVKPKDYHEVLRKAMRDKLYPNCPESCPKHFYEKVIRLCWKEEPNIRPTFGELQSILSYVKI